MCANYSDINGMRHTEGKLYWSSKRWKYGSLAKRAYVVMNCLFMSLKIVRHGVPKYLALIIDQHGIWRTPLYKIVWSYTFNRPKEICVQNRLTLWQRCTCTLQMSLTSIKDLISDRYTQQCNQTKHSEQLFRQSSSSLDRTCYWVLIQCCRNFATGLVSESNKLCPTLPMIMPYLWVQKIMCL